MNNRGATKTIAEFALKTTYAEFNRELLQHAKHLLLTSIGMCLVGSTVKQSKAVIEYARSLPQSDEAGAWGCSFTSSPEVAALVNGTTSHSSEYEAVLSPESCYQVGVFPGVFSLGEKLHISGKQAIEDFVIAFEIAGRIAAEARPGYMRGFSMAPVYCALGVSAGCSKMLNLDIEKTINAIAIAATHACGLMINIGRGTHLFESGLASRNGVESARLAQQGLYGNPNAIEMKGGILDVLASVTNPVIKFGENGFRTAGLGQKKFPCCSAEQNIMLTFQSLINEHSIKPFDIKQITVDVHPAFVRTVHFQHPISEEEARFSLPHSLAVILLDKKVNQDSYTNERINDVKVKALRDKVIVNVHPEWESPGLGGHDNPMTIQLTNGTEYKKVSPSADVPIILTTKEAMEQYMDCALRVITKKRAEQVAEMVLNLEKVDDITKISKLVTFPDKA